MSTGRRAAPGEALREHYQGPFLGSSNCFHKGDGHEQNELPLATPLQVPQVLEGHEFGVHEERPFLR